MVIQVLDIETVQKFSVDEVQPILLHQSKGLVTLLVCLEADQRLDRVL